MLISIISLFASLESPLRLCILYEPFLFFEWLKGLLAVKAVKIETPYRITRHSVQIHCAKKCTLKTAGNTRYTNKSIQCYSIGLLSDYMLCNCLLFPAYKQFNSNPVLISYIIVCQFSNSGSSGAFISLYFSAICSGVACVPVWICKTCGASLSLYP